MILFISEFAFYPMKEARENAHRMEILLQNLIPHFVRTASFRLVPAMQSYINELFKSFWKNILPKLIQTYINDTQ